MTTISRFLSSFYMLYFFIPDHDNMSNRLVNTWESKGSRFDHNIRFFVGKQRGIGAKNLVLLEQRVLVRSLEEFVIKVGLASKIRLQTFASGEKLGDLKVLFSNVYVKQCRNDLISPTKPIIEIAVFGNIKTAPQKMYLPKEECRAEAVSQPS